MKQMNRLKTRKFNIIERQIRLYFSCKYLPNDFATDAIATRNR